MQLIKVFEIGGSDQNEAAANQWLKEHPDVKVQSASCHPMHDRYTYGEGPICNQWVALILICEGGPNDE